MADILMKNLKFEGDENTYVIAPEWDNVQNVPSNVEPFVVNITKRPPGSDNFVADKTVSEIREAAYAGKFVYATINTEIFTLDFIGVDDVEFQKIYGNCYIQLLHCTDSSVEFIGTTLATESAVDTKISEAIGSAMVASY